MAGACSSDLRSRVLAAVEEGETPDAAARRFAMDRSTVHRRVAAVRDEGRRAAKPTGARPRHLSLAEIASRLAEAHGVSVYLTTVHRALRRAGWTGKKLSLRAAEQERADVAQARRAWRTDPDAAGGVSPERLVFLDECGVPEKPQVCAWTSLSRLRGRSPRGQRARASAPFGHWPRVTVPGTLGAEGIVGATSMAAAASAAVFHAYLGQALLPGLRRSKPDAVLVMDPRKSLRDFADLAAHKAAEVGALLDRSGLACRHLPAYSQSHWAGLSQVQS